MNKIKAFSIIKVYREQPELYEKYQCTLSDIENNHKRLKERLSNSNSKLSDEELVILSALFIRDIKPKTQEEEILRRECLEILTNLIEV